MKLFNLVYLNDGMTRTCRLKRDILFKIFWKKQITFAQKDPTDLGRDCKDEGAKILIYLMVLQRLTYDRPRRPPTERE